MARQRHKRKKRRMVIFASDAVDAKVEQHRYHPWIVWIVISAVSVFIGGSIGYFYFERDVWTEKNLQTASQQEQIERLEQEKAELEDEVASLNETIRILSETVNQKTFNETQLAEQLEKRTMPTEFPLTGSATMEDAAEGDPMCIFTTSEGAMVVATAGGTVTAVNNDADYGHNIWVDHGNGYVTIYRNAGEVKVKQGETVNQGTTLILITDGNSKLGYQMMKDGVYIDPMDMLAISG
ncbi:MAG: peptidoglycan DD-metalloendopeptidase family protein [bacterium]|nr:peptidoglycan DD-metalloendopeptidase family protein [bacterium]